jgi:hypothetical protein
VWAAATAEGEQRLAIRWLGGTIAWSAVALAVLAPSLQTVVAGLPNDHYHAFVDPIVVVLLGVSAVVVAFPTGGRPRPRQVDLVIRASLVAALAFLVTIGVSRWPPALDPNGGWPEARIAGARVVATTGAAPVALFDVPDFKTPDGIGFPIVYAGGVLVDDAGAARYFVVPCDRLFEAVVLASCGGQAEDRVMAGLAAQTGQAMPTLVARFDASRRTSVSIYRP